MATPPTATSGLGYSHGQPFDTVLRGYERRQVDDFVAKSNDEIIRLKEDLAEAQRQRRLATEHAEATERELRELQGKSAHAEPIAVEDSFGYRAEKLLRMADQEAADMRAGATRDAEAVEAAARRRAEEQLRAAEAQGEGDPRPRRRGGRKQTEAGFPGGGAAGPPVPQHEGGDPAAGRVAERRGAAARPGRWTCAAR